MICKWKTFVSNKRINKIFHTLNLHLIYGFILYNFFPQYVIILLITCNLDI